MNTKLNPKWNLQDGTTRDFIPMTDNGPIDFYDTYWTRGDFNYTVWLRDGRPEGIISDSKTQNWKFDDYEDDVQVDGVVFKYTDDGSIFFDCDQSMSPDEVLKSLIKIAENSSYLSYAILPDYDDDEDDDDYWPSPADEEEDY